MIRLFIFLSFITSSLWALQTVKIGVLAKRSADITLKNYSATADYLTKEIEGYEFEIVPLSFEELGQSVAKSEIDFLLTNTAYYVELEHLYGVSRIATLKNKSSDDTIVSSFGGVILSRADADIQSLEDLKGKKFVAVDPNSFGGWIMAQKELLDHGIEMDDFSQFKFLGSHDSVVLAIIHGDADAGTVRTDTLERMIDEKAIETNSFKILAEKRYKSFPFRVSTALYPEWPFAKLPKTSQRLADAVALALLKMPASSQAAKRSHIEGWTIPLDYSKVHRVLEELNLSFYGELKEFTFGEFYEKYKVWFLFVSIAFVVVFALLVYIYRLNSGLKKTKSHIEKLNGKLEKKVLHRTQQLESMYSQEKYLKNLLSTITDINELLISSYSKQTIIHNTMKILAKLDEYNFTWIGSLDGNLLKIIEQSPDSVPLLEKQSYNLTDSKLNSSLLIAKESLESNRTIINKLEHSSDWMIALPLQNSERDRATGVLCIYCDTQGGFIDEEVKILENLVTDLSFTLNAIKQQSILNNMELEKISNYEETILAFVNIIEQRDKYTAGHTLRVARYSRLIAQEMGIDKDDIVKLEKAAILHDIGKVVTPDTVLLKPDKLTPLEYELIKQHSIAGYKMLSKIEMYKDLAQIIKYHHIHYDGSGYPEIDDDPSPKILLLSYILSAADAFDAMTSNRIYKIKKTAHEAIEEILHSSGEQFHPKVIQAAKRALANITIEDTSQLPDTEFEERRFSYFFRDSLTDLYNENYLQIVLHYQEDDERCFNLIKLKNFSHYNHKHGWESGNRLLKTLSTHLQRDYPDAMIFRYHGDDFILLFSKHQDIEKQDILSYEIFKDTELSVEVQHYDLKDGLPPV